MKVNGADKKAYEMTGCREKKRQSLCASGYITGQHELVYENVTRNQIFVNSNKRPKIST